MMEEINKLFVFLLFDKREIKVGELIGDNKFFLDTCTSKVLMDIYY
jgi:hypothetical protein